MPPATGSSSSASSHAEVEAGTVVDGFRVERLLGGGPVGAVYEATQLSLGRTVALRLLDAELFAAPGVASRFDEQQRRSASVHHANLVPTFKAGRWEGGRYVAARYVRGRTLADLLEDDALRLSRPATLLEPIGDALEAAHAAGLVHGQVTARNVLVDAAGRPYLADLGLGRPGTISGDRADLAALVSRVERRARRRGLRSLAAPGLPLAAIGVVATVVLLGEDGGGDDRAPAPRVVAGARPLGSDLAPGPVRGVGCAREPGPNTPACTLSQVSIAGRSLAVRQAGVIRAWAVRGARGDLTLQVIRGRGGVAFQHGFSQRERAPDDGPHVFEANVPVEPGDRVGVLLGPGAVIGARAPRGDTSALRWDGALDFVPRRQRSTALGGELLLRADIERGARPDLHQLSGRRLAAAPTGRALAEVALDVPGGRATRLLLVRVADDIALDARRGRRRLARVVVRDARPGGRLLEFDGHCGYRRGLCLRWLNEGESTPVVHAYALSREGDRFRVIG